MILSFFMYMFVHAQNYLKQEKFYSRTLVHFRVLCRPQKKCTVKKRKFEKLVIPFIRQPTDRCLTSY